MLFDDGMVGDHTNPLPKHALDAVWNQIAVGGVTMRQAISKWWAADATKEPGPWLVSCSTDAAMSPKPLSVVTCPSRLSHGSVVAGGQRVERIGCAPARRSRTPRAQSWRGQGAAGSVVHFALLHQPDLPRLSVVLRLAKLPR